MQRQQNVRTLVFAALFVMGCSTTALAQDFRVIVHASNPVDSMRSDELSRMLLKKNTAWDHGGSVRPVDLNADSAVRQVLSKKIHHKSVSAIKSYWQQRIFSGRGVPPAELGSDDEVIAYVRRNAGAVGYVSAAASLTGVRAIELRN